MQQLHIFSLWFDPIGLEPTIYRTLTEHANHYATDAIPIKYRQHKSDWSTREK